MAVVHISRTDAANEFEGLMARAVGGDEVCIESGERVVARLVSGEPPRLRLLSDSLRILRERDVAVTLDEDFPRDLEEVIESRTQPLSPPAWD